MKIALLTLVGLGLPILIWRFVPRSEPRLQGTWRSNKKETIEMWRRDGLIPEKVVDRYGNNVLGRMSVTYSGRRVKSSTGTDWAEDSEYRVVESGTDFVVFDQYSEVWERMFRWKVRFVKDGYWTSNNDIIKGYTEKFDLVSRQP